MTAIHITDLFQTLAIVALAWLNWRHHKRLKKAEVELTIRHVERR